jgi:hypothetical protein
MVGRAATRSDRRGVRFAEHHHPFLQALQALAEGAAYMSFANARHPEHEQTVPINDALLRLFLS